MRMDVTLCYIDFDSEKLQSIWCNHKQINKDYPSETMCAKLFLFICISNQYIIN